MNSSVRKSFTLWTYISHLCISDDGKHFPGFSKLLSIPVTFFNAATYSICSGLLKTDFWCIVLCCEVFDNTYKRSGKKWSVQFLMHSKTEYRNDFFVEIIRHQYLQEPNLSHLPPPPPSLHIYETSSPIDYLKFFLLNNN